MAETTQATTAGQTPAAPETFIGKKVVAKRLNKTVRTVDNWMAQGLLPYYKIGHSVSFKWSEIETALARTCRVSRCG
jgi:predicted DNA-binding transcriptional regulator AlpA